MAYTSRKELVGVEAVIDKDYTAGLMARELGAERLVILTDVDQVYVRFGTRGQKGLGRLPAEAARRHLAAGEFPPGSMGPKVETAVEFVERTGGEAVITRPEHLWAALSGRSGTTIVRGRAGGRRRER